MVIKARKLYSDHPEATIRPTKSNPANPVHQRLYARSKIRQNEGRELREQIETARKAKLFAPVKRIPPQEAEHLYGRLYSDYFKKQNELEALAIQAAEKESKELAVKRSMVISETSAKKLFNRLYEEKTSSLTRNVPDDNLEQEKKRPAPTISEKMAQRLYNRLHQEKTSSLLAPPIAAQKIQNEMCRISQSAAQELYRRLSSEKTLSMTVDGSTQKKKSSHQISKKSADQLFSRLASEKTLSMKAKDIVSAQCDDLSSGISKSNSSRNSKTLINGTSEVHQRLYARSQSRQNEGREKREQIKMKTEYVQKPTPKMSERTAKRLFDRLYTKKTCSVAAKHDNDETREEDFAKPRIISEKAAVRLFDRLHNNQRSPRRRRAEV